MDVLAQEEIRAYGNIIGNEIVRRWCPITWEAFRDYRLKGLSLSDMEIQLISACAAGNSQQATALALEYGLLKKENERYKTTLELEEIEAKLTALKIAIPWQR